MAEEQENAMKTQHRKMKAEFLASRCKSPEAKEESEICRKKRERDASLALSASGVSKRKLDIDALETVMNTLTYEEVMKLATKF